VLEVERQAVAEARRCADEPTVQVSEAAGNEAAVAARLQKAAVPPLGGKAPPRVRAAAVKRAAKAAKAGQ
jgi:hypothetical protein